MSAHSALLLTEVGKPLIKGAPTKLQDHELKDKEVLVKITAAGREH